MILGVSLIVRRACEPLCSVSVLLDDCWLLHGRAEGQLRALRTDIDAFFQQNAARLVVEDDAKTRHKLV